jgi:hypothetical protein
MSHASTALYLHRGSRDTRTGHTRDTGAHGHTDARITQTKLTTIPTHQRYTNAHTRTTTETANSRNPDSGTRRVGPEVSLFRHARGKIARKVTHPSAALREVAEQRHGRRRSWPCTAFARHQESVAPNFKIEFEQSSTCQSPSNSRLS